MAKMEMMTRSDMIILIDTGSLIIRVGVKVYKYMLIVAPTLRNLTTKKDILGERCPTFTVVVSQCILGFSSMLTLNPTLDF